MSSYECLFSLPQGDIRVLNFTRQCIDRSVSEALHSHEFIKIMRITEGEAVWQLGTECLRIVSGDIILLNSTEQRRFVRVLSNQVNFEWIQFTPLTVYPNIETAGTFYRRPKNFNNIIRRDELKNEIEKKYFDKIERYFLLLSENASCDNLLKEQAIISNLSSLLIELTRFFHTVNEECKIDRNYCTLENYQIMTNAVEYIRENFKEQFSEKELAKHLSISPSYFSRLFPYFYGIGFKEYLRRIRLDSALELLRINKNKTNVLDAALASGFNSSSGFYKALKEIKGDTTMKLLTG